MSFGDQVKKVEIDLEDDQAPLNLNKKAHVNFTVVGDDCDQMDYLQGIQDLARLGGFDLQIISGSYNIHYEEKKD